FMVWGQDLSLAPATRPEESSANESDGKLFWRLMTLACILVTLNIGWQFLRAWMPLFLVDYHKYSQKAMSYIVSGYFISSDVGCILSGALVTFLAAYGWHVDRARKLGFFVFVLLAGCAAFVPLAGSGPFLIVLLYLAGAGVLGLHPYYYAMVQELPKNHIGLLSGVLTASGWIVLSVFQANVGTYVKQNASYDLAFYVVGLIPVIGLIALLTIWPKPLQSAGESTR
ncbi:MAG: MFS transporter, partial [Planctomycetota bacterium]|nr:MFS transporter [Planctomycetota bacterium]